MRTKSAAEAVHRLQYMALSKKTSECPADDISVIIVDLLPDSGMKSPFVSTASRGAVSCLARKPSAMHMHDGEDPAFQAISAGLQLVRLNVSLCFLNAGGSGTGFSLAATSTRLIQTEQVMGSSPLCHCCP